MSRFYLDIINGHGIAVDHEGIEADTYAALAAIAYDSIRSMVAEDARQGIIDLHGKIVVRNAIGEERASFNFTEAFQLLIPRTDMP